MRSEHDEAFESAGRSTAPDPRSRRRRTVVVLVAIAALVMAAGSAPRPAAADSVDDETAFIHAINQIRADLGLPALEPMAELTATARQHSAEMAAAGEIFHGDPISAGLTVEWVKLGENVGVGAGIEVLVDAFLASPGHYANIIDPSFTRIGVGVVWSGDSLYTTHRFLQPPADPGAEPAPPTAPPTVSTVAGSTVPTGTEPTVPTGAEPTVPTGAEPAPATEEPAVSAERAAALYALLDDIG
jgi:uncharacterized protein YkwD